MLYQWGRKDPFTNTSNGTAVQSSATPIYDSSDAQITTDTDGFPKIDNNSQFNVLKDAAQNPMNYYYSASNWTKDDNNLWTAISKSAFDPCPPGWRVPAGGTTATNNPWAGFYDRNASNSTSSGIYDATSANNIFNWYAANSDGQNIIGSTGRLYSVDNTKAWYPASGFRDNTSSAFTYTGSNGRYWSSTVTGVSGYGLNFNSASIFPSYGYHRAGGFSVRCVQQ